tara:strand:- start:380 stop:544 length:165 start_codon:yes stop_codon:yes gene_type:complete
LGRGNKLCPLLLALAFDGDDSAVEYYSSEYRFSSPSIVAFSFPYFDFPLNLPMG